MKKIIQNYKVSFNLLLLTTAIVFFSSCAREKGAVSYNNEKLRKQSQEIENSKPSESNINSSKVEKEIIAAPSSIGTKETSSKETTTSSNIAGESKKSASEAKSRKMSPVQKLMVKKLAKTLDPNENLETKRGGLDQNLKLAIIFGVIGLILTLFGWPFYLIGVILIIIGLVFLLLWVLNQ